MKTNTATFIEYPETHIGARNLSPDKEMVRAASLIIDHEEMVTARWYMGRSNTATVVYCSVWCKTQRADYKSGFGTARGYGYHKVSAAFDHALRDAGIKLSEDIDGVGDGAIDEALHAIGDAMGYPMARDNRIIVQHA